MSNFDGYLLKIKSGNTYVNFPNKYIQIDSWVYTQNSQDLDSYRDGNGLLHRTPLDDKVKVEWNSPFMEIDNFRAMISLFTNNYVDKAERKLNVKYYDIWTDSYLEGVVYMPDASIQFYRIIPNSNRIQVRPVRFVIIEY